MKTVQAGLVFLFRWLPIVAAAALIAWDFWGKAPIHRHHDQNLTALAARDGRLHVLYVTLGADRTLEAATFSPDRNTFRIKLSRGGLSVPFIEAPPPLLSPSLGFQSEAFTTAVTGTHFRRVVVPEWPLLLGLIGLSSSGLMIGIIRRRRRKFMGQCTSCGYELHGTSGSCRECGNLAPTAV